MGRNNCMNKEKATFKKNIKKAAAILVDKLVLYAIKKANYVITSSYEYHYRFSNTKKVFLTPPMINVTEKDLELTFDKSECYITYCGELRHAKGILLYQSLYNCCTFPSILNVFIIRVNRYISINKSLRNVVFNHRSCWTS